jgi:hypothetical protein
VWVEELFFKVNDLLESYDLASLFAEIFLLADSQPTRHFCSPFLPIGYTYLITSFCSKLGLYTTVIPSYNAHLIMPFLNNRDSFYKVDASMDVMSREDCIKMVLFE